MSTLNKKKESIYTHEGTKAQHINPELLLRRSVMSSMLWEDTFYEDGQSIANRIADTIKKVDPKKVARIAIEAREQMKLRHVPLLIVREMARLDTHKKYVARTLFRIIQRADELTEFLAIYWKDKKQSLSGQVKKGLGWAFTKFDAYQLAKYDRQKEIKLRDVLFLTHAKPKDKEQEGVWKKLVNGELETPDTWEVSLSASQGENKKEIWERLLKENKLGALALLRNLRNFKETGVDLNLILNALDKMKVEKILPFRFIAAARAVPEWENYIEPLMLKCLQSFNKLPGRTALLVDVSGSMGDPISRKSDLSRMDAANALAILLREICEQVAIVSFSDMAVVVPPRRGFALADAIKGSQPNSGTNGAAAVQAVNNQGYDRIIVITDEQWMGSCPDPLPNTKAYFINVAACRNGIGYSKWLHIDGWSEQVINFIQEYEKNE